MPPVFQAGGREPTGVNQSPQAASNYPFVAPSDDISLLFSDLWLSFQDDLNVYTPPFHVAWLHGFGSNIVAPIPGFPTPTNPYDIVIEDALGAFVFSSPGSQFLSQTWGSGNYLLLQWILGEQVCKASIYLTWPPGSTPKTYNSYIAPVNGELDGRAYGRIPRRVTGFKVGSTIIQAKNVIFEAGYNVVFAVQPQASVDGGVQKTTIDVSALPGQGIGKAPGCVGSQTVLRTINDVGGDAQGRFTLDASQCLRVGPPLVEQAPVTTPPTVFPYDVTLDAQDAKAALRLSNDCTVCCPCSYYARTYKGIRKIWKEQIDIGHRIDAVVAEQTSNTTRWNTQKACREAHPFQMLLTTEGLGRIGVSTSFCNLTEACLSPVEVLFNFTTYANGVVTPITGIQCNRAFIQSNATNGERRYTLNGTWGGGYNAVFDYLDPLDAAVVKFRLCVPLTGTAVQTLQVTISIHTPDPLPTRSGVIVVLPVIGPSDAYGPKRYTFQQVTPVDHTDPRATICTC